MSVSSGVRYTIIRGTRVAIAVLMFGGRTTQADEEQAAEAAAKTGVDPAVMAAGVSVLLSWYYFFARGERDLGLFVSLWPPTILAFASYFNQTRMSDKLEASVRGPGGSIKQLVR